MAGTPEKPARLCRAARWAALVVGAIGVIWLLSSPTPDIFYVVGSPERSEGSWAVRALQGTMAGGLQFAVAVLGVVVIAHLVDWAVPGRDPWEDFGSW